MNWHQRCDATSYQDNIPATHHVIPKLEAMPLPPSEALNIKEISMLEALYIYLHLLSLPFHLVHQGKPSRSRPASRPTHTSQTHPHDHAPHTIHKRFFQSKPSSPSLPPILFVSFFLSSSHPKPQNLAIKINF